MVTLVVVLARYGDATADDGGHVAVPGRVEVTRGIVMVGGEEAVQRLCVQTIVRASPDCSPRTPCRSLKSSITISDTVDLEHHSEAPRAVPAVTSNRCCTRHRRPPTSSWPLVWI